MHSQEIRRMIHAFSMLPGLGPRSGKRVSLHLLKNSNRLLPPLIHCLEDIYKKIKTCRICHNIDVQDPCFICNDPKRESDILCVVADIADVWAFEKAHIFKGKYHILGGVLSAIEGISPKELNLPSLLHRCHQQEVKEVVLALNATVDGQTTLHYLFDQLKDFSLKVSTLAHGVPIGGELDFLDDGTLLAAFKERRRI